MCSAPCSLGVPGGCGVDPASKDKPAAACLPLLAGEAAGDVGGCFQLCDCDGDCLNGSFLCNPTTTSLGKTGVCVPADQALGHVACPADGGLSLGAGGNSGTGAGGATGAPDAGPDGGSTAPKGGDSGGCGCHVGERRDSQGSGTLAFAALGLALLARRRGARRSA